MKLKITIEQDINNCLDCQFHKYDGCNVKCSIAQNKCIADQVEYKTDVGPIPEWCPCEKEN